MSDTKLLNAALQTMFLAIGGCAWAERPPAPSPAARAVSPAIRIVTPPQGLLLPALSPLLVSVEVSAFPTPPRREILLDDRLLAVVSSPPYEVVTTVPNARNVSITARTVTTNGTKLVENRPLNVEIAEPSELDAESAEAGLIGSPPPPCRRARPPSRAGLLAQT